MAKVIGTELVRKAPAGLSASAQPGPIAERLTSLSDQVNGTLEGVRRLAGQASAVGDALGTCIDTLPLTAERVRATAAGPALR